MQKQANESAIRHQKVSPSASLIRTSLTIPLFISAVVYKVTGYEFDDIVGRKCRFLQGEKTSPTDEKRISDASKSEEECSVNLLNYEKDGTEFVDEVRLL